MTFVAEPGGLRVLIAEDDEINRTVAEALLAKRGFRTAIAHNGREAVEMAGADDYAAIFMDCQMPELDGYDATRRIRDSEHDRRALIIAMTAHSMRGDRENCLAAGMDDYLSKPIQSERLDAVLRRWLPKAEVLDQDRIAALRRTLPAEELQQLNRMFADSLSTRLAAIENAMRSGDQAGIEHTAHLLKGSSLNLGASRLTQICQQLEVTSREQGPVISEDQFVEFVAVATEARHALSEHLL